MSSNFKINQSIKKKPESLCKNEGNFGWSLTYRETGESRERND